MPNEITLEEIQPDLKQQVTLQQHQRWVKIAAIISLVIAPSIYVLRLDRVVGLLIDDAWYVLLAKALATGQGYTLINSPTPGILPLYPPAFPFILSLVYRLSPSFPENLWLLKSVSIVAMIAVGILSYRYFLRVRKLPDSVALGIAVATTICPPLVFLAVSSVMSDCVFMLFAFLTIVLVERCVSAKQSSWEWRYAILAGTLASVAFLTRSIAIGLLIAAPLYLLKERMVRSVIIFSLTAAFFAGPWIANTRLNAPTPEQQMEQGGYIVLPYSLQFWQRLAGDSTQGEITAGELPRRVFDNTLEVLGRDVSRILMTLIFEALRDPIKEAERLNIEGASKQNEILPFSLFLSIFVILGFITVVFQRLTFAEIAVPMMFGVIVLWPFETVRYVLPLTPFVIFYFVMGVRKAQEGVKWLLKRSNPRRAWAMAQAALIAIIAINLYGNLLGIYVSYFKAPLEGSAWERKFEEVETLFKRLDQVALKSDVIVSTNPALIHLYTGRKTVCWDNPALRWETWKQLNVRYLVWNMFYPQPIHPAEKNFNTVYMSRDGSLFRIVDFGPPGTRGPWPDN